MVSRQNFGKINSRICFLFITPIYYTVDQRFSSFTLSKINLLDILKIHIYMISIPQNADLEGSPVIFGRLFLASIWSCIQTVRQTLYSINSLEWFERSFRIIPWLVKFDWLFKNQSSWGSIFHEVGERWLQHARSMKAVDRDPCGLRSVIWESSVFLSLFGGHGGWSGRSQDPWVSGPLQEP